MSSASPSSTSRRAESLDRRHIERRELISRWLLPAVERLLEEQTYPSLTVDQMVAEAELSRSTFYNYFEDKSDLLRALTGDVMSTIVDATRMWWQLAPSGTKDEFHAALAHLFAIYSPHTTLMRAVAESISHDARVREEFMAYMASGQQGIADYIRTGQTAGVLRTDLDADATAAWLTWMMERGLSQLSLGSGEYEPERVLAAVVDILWKALH
ncbi:TetR/AcrR family transcriptional regulator [Sporichthya polymorpha]|uniref:TetR/AcrR family transcriptional regulator n=1 Tax=Sporichthya polymorpha TaxID=35751 RepID=UPI000364BEEE|nr:TetR/AcrR family transcriptional regulator [Sporichthya polymorpha]